MLRFVVVCRSGSEERARRAIAFFGSVSGSVLGGKTSERGAQLGCGGVLGVCWGVVLGEVGMSGVGVVGAGAWFGFGFREEVVIVVDVDVDVGSCTAGSGSGSAARDLNHLVFRALVLGFGFGFVKHISLACVVIAC